MKSTILTLVLLLVSLTLCNAQQIEMKKAFGTYQYTQDGNRLTMRELMTAMESNSEALIYMKKSQSNNAVASVFGAGGGFLIGWTIGGAIGGGDTNWTLAGVGAGLAVIAIPFSVSANKHAEKAVGLYNASLGSNWPRDFKPELSLLANGNGLGLSITF